MPRWTCSADDEFWLVLYGHGGRSQGGAPAFQVSGPRLTAPDLKTALDAIPARQQYVFIGTSNSGAFLPVLRSPRRTIACVARLALSVRQQVGRFSRLAGVALAQFVKDQKAANTANSFGD